MKKQTILSTLLIATTLCFTGISFAQPCPLEKEKPKSPEMQEFAMPRFDIGQQILTDKELNLTVKQREKILKSDQKTRKQIQRYEDKIAKMKFKKHKAVRKHLDTINETLTPEQKRILEDRHQRRIHEFISQYKQPPEMNKNHENKKPYCEKMQNNKNGHCDKAPCEKKQCHKQKK